ncbi:hypothetical protein RHOSPDRAFT_36272 [Rhodotorula sp. JG-1b]|nr:hypothetical protein RHOSPDRAFT_36272 [Rhodotorula sp. JG-1b]
MHGNRYPTPDLATYISAVPVILAAPLGRILVNVPNSRIPCPSSRQVFRLAAFSSSLFRVWSAGGGCSGKMLCSGLLATSAARNPTSEPATHSTSSTTLAPPLVARRVSLTRAWVGRDPGAHFSRRMSERAMALRASPRFLLQVRWPAAAAATMASSSAARDLFDRISEPLRSLLVSTGKGPDYDAASRILKSFGHQAS